MEQRTCRGCGTSFDINPRERNPRQWCSGKCRAWHLKHPDEPRPAGRTCGHCGKCIDHMRILAKWCSPECGYLGRGGGATKADRQCPVCRKRFTAAGNKRFCSAPCRRAHGNATRRGSLDRLLAEPWSPPTPFDCAHCGKRCVPGENVARHAAKFCGKECKKQWHRDPLTVRRGPVCRVTKTKPRYWVEGRCPECGDRFVRRVRTGAAGYCSKRCQLKVKARRHNHAKRGKGRMTLTYWTIAERDNWRCQLCGEVVDREASVPSHAAPTLDHVIPLSKGGEHSERNVQLAHFICNSRKSDGAAVPVGGQLALV